MEKDKESRGKKELSRSDAGKGSGCFKEEDIRGRTFDERRMTEEDDVMSNHVVVCSCERMNVGGGELGTGQSHIVYPQHVLYQLFESRASVGAIRESVGFPTRIMGDECSRCQRDPSACSDTGLSYFSKAG